MPLFRRLRPVLASAPSAPLSEPCIPGSGRTGPGHDACESVSLLGRVARGATRVQIYEAFCSDPEVSKKERIADSAVCLDRSALARTFAPPEASGSLLATTSCADVPTLDGRHDQPGGDDPNTSQAWVNAYHTYESQDETRVVGDAGPGVPGASGDRLANGGYASGRHGRASSGGGVGGSHARHASDPYAAAAAASPSGGRAGQDPRSVHISRQSVPAYPSDRYASHQQAQAAAALRPQPGTPVPGERYAQPGPRYPPAGGLPPPPQQPARHAPAPYGRPGPQASQAPDAARRQTQRRPPKRSTGALSRQLPWPAPVADRGSLRRPPRGSCKPARCAAVCPP